MKEFQEQRLVRKIARSWIMAVVICTVLIFVTRSTYSMYGKYRESKSARELAEKHLHELETRSEYLSETVERLSTEEGVEEEIRRQFNMVKNGEEFAIITSRPTDLPKIPTDTTWWSKFTGFFGF